MIGERVKGRHVLFLIGSFLLLEKRTKQLWAVLTTAYENGSSPQGMARLVFEALTKDERIRAADKTRKLPLQYGTKLKQGHALPNM